VIDKLGEIADLGVTAILLYPVMQNDERPIKQFLPTGYRPKDYEHVDRNFGDLPTLCSLVAAAHARGIRVILDMPITLPGFEHPFLADPKKKDWFGPRSEYGVPRWKVENPAVADYLIGVCKRWKERTECDGFRIDSAHLQPIAFWKRFVAELKSGPAGENFLILPELTISPQEIGKFVSAAGFDGAYDFSVLRCREVFGRGEDVEQLSFIARQAKQFYPRPRTMLAAIDNYEKSFTSNAQEPKATRTRLALTYLLTLDRVPLLYAGNELGLAFDDVGGAFPDNRRDSPFLQEIKALIALRHSHPALRRGTFTEVFAGNLVYAFVRELADDRILVVLNGAARPQKFAAIAQGELVERQCVDLLKGQVVKAAGSDEAITLEAFGALVLSVL
jgi:alpha-amylase